MRVVAVVDVVVVIIVFFFSSAGVASGGDRPGLEHAPLCLPRRIRSVRRPPLPGLPVCARMVSEVAMQQSRRGVPHRTVQADSGRSLLCGLD